LEVATRAIDAEKLGQGTGTDVLSISFSSNDAVGHRVGPDSPEVRDISIRTDRVLGKLLQHVDDKVGLANTIVVLTADHGVAPVPEIMEKEKMPAGRIPGGTLRAAAEKALAAKYGDGKWVSAGAAEIYLNHSALQEKNIPVADAQHVVAAAWSAIPHVARVYSREDLRAGRISDDYIGRRMRNGFYYDRFADVVAILEPFWLGEKTGGTSHGTPYNYDSHVPVIFMGQGIRAGRYNQRITVNDIAPTLASLLDVETPAGAIGRVLDEMLPPRQAAAVAGGR
jgi:arylsulfatase A-like enzyme